VSFAFYSELSTLYSALSFPLPQQFSLNCCCATPRRTNHGEWLRQNRLFGLFAAVVKSSIADIKFSMAAAAKAFSFALSY
jgi:hypothetical protein